MGCPDRAELAGLVAGRLPPDRQEALERHLDTCPACARQLEDASGLTTLLPPGPSPEGVRPPPSDALKRVMADLGAARPAPPEPTAALAETRRDARFPYLRPTDRPGFLGRLGVYEIRREVGRGGMGVVFEGLDPALDRPVAVKVFSPLAADDAARDRFLREARAAAAPEHESVVTVHAVDQADGVPFLVMQFVAGESLAERLARERRLPLAEVIRIGAQASRGLAAAHAKGLIHRDVKPANILLEADTGRVKVADFGLAKAIGEASLTAVGTVVGTPEYMSPEQTTAGRESHTLDARSDLFSLGVVLYTACAGSAPFRAETPRLTIDRVRHHHPAPLNQIDPTVPAWFAAVVQKLLMKAPADRLASAAELAAVLEHTRTTPAVPADEIPPPPAPPARRAGRPWRWAAALAGVLAIAAAVALYANRDRSGEQAGPLPPPQPDAKDQPGPMPVPRAGFVVAGGAETYRTLTEAAAAARDGDAVTVHGDGPFPSPPVRLGAKPLTVRAAPGSRPVLVSAVPDQIESGPLLRSDADLHLEGLEIRWTIVAPKGTAEEVLMAHCAVFHTRGRLTISHCRFAPGKGSGSVGASGRELVVANCHFAAPDGFGILCRPEPAGRVAVEGCQFENLIAVSVYTPADGPNPDPAAADVLLAGNTFASADAVRLLLNFERKQPLKVTARRNVFDTDHLVMLLGPLGKKGDKPAESTRPEVITNYLRSFVEWSDDANLYRRGCKYLVTTTGLKAQVHSARIDGPGGWAKLWKRPDTRSVEGAIRFRERPPSTPPQPLRLVPVGDASGPVPEPVGADPDRLGPGRQK